MPDTVRTLSALQALLADNTAGDISPQDVRDMLVSTYQLDYSADTSITGTATATIGKWHICSGTTSDYTLTLPAASGNAGKLIGLRMSSALTKLVTIDGNASETIDGALTRVMWANEVAVLFCDGTGWTKVAGKSIPMRAMIVASALEVPARNGFQTFALTGTPPVDVGSMAVAASSKVTTRRAGTYLCLANGSIDGLTDTNPLILTVVAGAATYRVSRISSAGTTTYSTSGSILLELAASVDIKAGVYYGETVDRQTEYINPDSRCFLVVAEQSPW